MANHSRTPVYCVNIRSPKRSRCSEAGPTGWDQGFQFAANGSSTFLGGIQYQTPDERTSVMWTVTTGYWGKGSTIHSGGVGGGPTTMSDGNIYDQSFVWQQMLGRNWTYVFQTDPGTQPRDISSPKYYQPRNGTAWSTTCSTISTIIGRPEFAANGSLIHRAFALIVQTSISLMPEANRFRV